ncbi:MAG: TMEM43 family protein [Mailhella sp.]|nr:TMEM43 family protein [Mailhella sp.]
MAYTETTQTSFFSRLGNSFSGIGMGIALFVAGTALLWWNEGDFVATRDALNETQAQTQIVGSADNLGPSFSGKVVHVTGYADTKQVLNDSEFGISQTAIALVRDVEYYQWTETSKQEKRQKLGGGEETVTVYNYHAKWVDEPVDSNRFRDPAARSGKVNYTYVQAKDRTVRATEVTFGPVRLPDFLISSISGAKPFDLQMSQEVKSGISQNIYRAFPELRPMTMAPVSNTQSSFDQRVAQTAPQQGAPLAPAQTVENKSAVVQMVSNALNPALGGEVVHVSGNTLYIGLTPGTPKVGDVRITYKAVYPSDISIIAKYNGTTFEKVYASNGKTVSRLNMGVVSSDQMFGKAHSSNSTWTWILRVVGTFLVIGGLKAIVAPLSVLASVIPLLGTIVGAGTGLVCSLLGFAWSLIIISIAWLRFRPVIGGAMIGVAVLLIAALYFKGRAKKAAPAAPAPQAPAE